MIVDIIPIPFNQGMLCSEGLFDTSIETPVWTSDLNNFSDELLLIGGSGNMARLEYYHRYKIVEVINGCQITHVVLTPVDLQKYKYPSEAPLMVVSTKIVNELWNCRIRYKSELVAMNTCFKLNSFSPNTYSIPVTALDLIINYLVRPDSEVGALMVKYIPIIRSYMELSSNVISSEYPVLVNMVSSINEYMTRIRDAIINDNEDLVHANITDLLGYPSAILGINSPVIMRCINGHRVKMGDLKPHIQNNRIGMYQHLVSTTEVDHFPGMSLDDKYTLSYPGIVSGISAMSTGYYDMLNFSTSTFDNSGNIDDVSYVSRHLTDKFSKDIPSTGKLTDVEDTISMHDTVAECVSYLDSAIPHVATLQIEGDLNINELFVLDVTADESHLGASIGFDVTVMDMLAPISLSRDSINIWKDSLM